MGPTWLSEGGLEACSHALIMHIDALVVLPDADAGSYCPDSITHSPAHLHPRTGESRVYDGLDGAESMTLDPEHKRLGGAVL